MLSYRHAFHAGNFADVLKHAVLVLALEHMVKKDKAFTYIDTHAGAGRYHLEEDYAQKTGEYRQGIERLWQRTGLPTALQSYVAIVRQMNPAGRLSVYPGSPLLAATILRPWDRGYLFELHPSDYPLLAETFAGQRAFRALHADGCRNLNSLLPTASRRGLILIDPSYELTTDYREVIHTIADGYRRFASGTYLLWYPVVKRQAVHTMEQQLCASGMTKILQAELLLQPDGAALGMTGAGLFMVNPPWTLEAQLREVLPYLAEQLGDQGSTYKLAKLADE